MHLQNLEKKLSSLGGQKQKSAKVEEQCTSTKQRKTEVAILEKVSLAAWCLESGMRTETRAHLTIEACRWQEISEAQEKLERLRALGPKKPRPSTTKESRHKVKKLQAALTNPKAKLADATRELENRRAELRQLVSV